MLRARLGELSTLTCSQDSGVGTRKTASAVVGVAYDPSDAFELLSTPSTSLAATLRFISGEVGLVAVAAVVTEAGLLDNPLENEDDKSHALGSGGERGGERGPTSELQLTVGLLSCAAMADPCRHSS